MQKIDWIIAGVGVVALVATTLGVLYEDDLTGAQDITFSLDERTLTVPQSAAFPSSTTLETAAGENATAATVDVTVNFAGNAIAPQGTASVRVTVTGPDGVALAPETQAMTINNAAAGGGATPLTFSFDLDFGTVPEDTTATDVADLDQATTWEEPYTISITVTSPGDPFTNGIGPAQATYSYTASATITESYYMPQIVAPEIEGGA